MTPETASRIPFFKMTGGGNDFIIIDNRSGRIDANRCGDLVRSACRRKLSVGADGLILVEDDGEVDFKWRFFNADGSEAEMCGNGARCVARFVHLQGIVEKPQMAFRTLAGVICAEMKGERVRIQTTTPQGMEANLTLQTDKEPFQLHFVNTGVPHAVCFVEDEAALEKIDVDTLGRLLRFHPYFQPAGANVNFAWVSDPNTMRIRTYERGVEGETLACGTGSVACALIGAALKETTSPVQVRTQGGEILTISFQQTGSDHFSEVYMEGDARVAFSAELWSETVKGLKD